MNTSKTLQKLFAATLLMSCIGSAMANESATLTVTGTIEPGSCDLNFEGGGEVDFGAYVVNGALGLVGDASSRTRVKNLNIICSSPMPVSLVFSDDNNSGDTGGEANFVVKLESGDVIGFYKLFPGEIVSDTPGLVMIDRLVESTQWSLLGSHVGTGMVNAFSVDGKTPAFIKNANIPITVNLALNDNEFEGLMTKKTFQGNTTVTLAYW